MTTATTGLKLKTYRNDHGHEFQAVEIDGVLVSLSKKDMSKSRNFLAKARVYGAVDVLAADLSALEPAYPYKGSGATDADRLTDMAAKLGRRDGWGGDIILVSIRALIKGIEDLPVGTLVRPHYTDATDWVFNVVEESKAVL